MLADIARVSLAVGTALFPEQSWQELAVSVGTGAAQKSPIERLGFIERILPDLAQALPQISRFPLTRMVTQTRPVAPPIRARRIGTPAILQAARRGMAGRHIAETVTAASQDTSENRAVQSFLAVLQKDCGAIAEIAEAEAEWEVRQRALSGQTQIRGLLAALCWEVTADSAAWAKPPTARAMGRAEYALVFAASGRYRREFVWDWEQPQFPLSPREPWRLYETWCLFRVLDGLLVLGYTPTAEQTIWSIREGRLLWTLAQGERSMITLRGPQGEALSVTYNAAFAQRERSLSRTMQPDITLEDLASETLWILDAKFKVYALPGEEGSDINQMHAYRDAILGRNGGRTVAHAWCLYAGLAHAPNRDRITYGTEDGPVGALCLRPGNEASHQNLHYLLAKWLAASPLPSAQPAFPETVSAPR